MLTFFPQMPPPTSYPQQTAFSTFPLLEFVVSGQSATWSVDLGKAKAKSKWRDIDRQTKKKIARINYREKACEREMVSKEWVERVRVGQKESRVGFADHSTRHFSPPPPLLVSYFHYTFLFIYPSLANPDAATSLDNVWRA